MKKILVISPSGEVYDHNCVRWYSEQGFDKNPEHYHNIGDAFVYDSSLKLLNFSSLNGLNIRNATDEDIERYNTQYAYAFLRGSNYLHPEMNWENAPTILEKLRIPILAFGIGAQAPAKGPLRLSKDAKRVLAIINERSVSLGVRGTYTADVLWSLGIKNIRIVGCPTVFRHNDPSLEIKLPEIETIKNVAYTLRREVGSDYAQDVGHYLRFQRESILATSKRFQIDILAQGEIEEKNILWGTEAQKEGAYNRLRTAGWLFGPGDPLENLYREHLFYADSVREFEELIQKKDLVLGYRLHGNLLGLANRIPAIYFTYDSRTTEFAETFQIPSFDVFSNKPFRLEDYWDQSLFDKFNRAYFQRYRDMRLFLNENDIDNVMVDETQKSKSNIS